MDRAMTVDDDWPWEADESSASAAVFFTIVCSAERFRRTLSSKGSGAVDGLRKTLPSRPVRPYGERLADLTYCSAGEEASDNARVWRVYQDRMNAMDEDTISAWNDSINFLLVFVRDGPIYLHNV